MAKPKAAKKAAKAAAPKKRRKGRGKGGAFERLVGRKLSSWLTRGDDDTQLIRSTSSGGWARGRKAPEGWRHAGDLAPNGTRGEEFVKRVATECKDRDRGREFDWWRIFSGEPNDGNIMGWWAQAVGAAGDKLMPCIVAHAQFRPVVIGFPTDFVLSFLVVADECPSLAFTHGELEPVMFIPFDYFLTIDPDDFLRSADMWLNNRQG